MKEIEANLKTKRLLAESEPTKQQSEASSYQLPHGPSEDISQGEVQHPLYELYFNLLNEELPVFLAAKYEEEALELLEFDMGLDSQAYAKKIQGVRLPFGAGTQFRKESSRG